MAQYIELELDEEGVKVGGHYDPKVDYDIFTYLSSLCDGLLVIDEIDDESYFSISRERKAVSKETLDTLVTLSTKISEIIDKVTKILNRHPWVTSDKKVITMKRKTVVKAPSATETTKDTSEVVKAPVEPNKTKTATRRPRARKTV